MKVALPELTGRLDVESERERRVRDDSKSRETLRTGVWFQLGLEIKNQAKAKIKDQWQSVLVEFGLGFEEKVKIQGKMATSTGIWVMAMVGVRARYPGPG